MPILLGSGANLPAGRTKLKLLPDSKQAEDDTGGNTDLRGP